MHGLSHFLHKHSRDSTPPSEKEERADSWYSSLSSNDSRGAIPQDSQERAIPINQRGSYAQRSLRGSTGAPFEFASSPRDRYPNFASYFRDVMETRTSSSSHHYHTHHADSRRRHEGDRYQTSVNTYQTPRNEYRQFVSPLFNDAMDDIQENEYSKCERYGEITNNKVSHTPYKSRFDNKNFAQKLTESVSSSSKTTSSERRGSGSSGSGHRHKHHSIQELIRTFGKKVGSWRHESGDSRRGSCAAPTTSAEQTRTMENDEFRSRSKSLDADHLHKVIQRPLLEDCGATYQIFDAILKEGIYLCFHFRTAFFRLVFYLNII